MLRGPVRILACADATHVADAVAELLGTQRTQSREVWFSCGEGKFVVDESVRGADCYLFQQVMVPASRDQLSGRTPYDRLMMALHAVDALRCAAAAQVTVVLPYLPGGRQDKRKGHVREGVSTGLFARLLTAAGATMVVTCDPHNEAIVGCYDPNRTVFEPVTLSEPLAAFLAREGLVAPGDAVASTDVGGLEMARRFAGRLSCCLVALSKERDYSRPNMVAQTTVIGDPAGRRVLLVDDIVDTAGSVVAAVEALWGAGALDIVVVGSHLVLSGPAWANLDALAARAAARGVGFRVVGTSAIEHATDRPYYRSFSIVPLLAQVVTQLHGGGSVRALEARGA